MVPLRRGYSCVSFMYVSFACVHARVLVNVMSTVMAWSLPVDPMPLHRIAGEHEHGIGISAEGSEGLQGAGCLNCEEPSNVFGLAENDYSGVYRGCG